MRLRATMLPLGLVPLAWLPAAAPARVVQGPAVVVPRAEGARCEGVVYDGRCLPPPRCGRDELDLDGHCLPAASLDEAVPVAMETNAHVDRAGRRVVYEHLPRRPELPADYDRYVYPVPPWGGQTVSSGYDLDRPDERQRRGESLSAVGHGGVDLAHERGTLVRVVGLRGEAGDAEVLFVGEMFGNTVVLRHVVRERGGAQTYVAIHGHLEAAAPGLARGQVVRPGTVIGYVGDSGALGVVHLHYEVRLVRPGIDPSRVEPPQRITDQEHSVPCDPRNVLPLRDGA